MRVIGSRMTRHQAAQDRGDDRLPDEDLLEPALHVHALLLDKRRLLLGNLLEGRGRERGVGKRVR